MFEGRHKLCYVNCSEKLQKNKIVENNNFTPGVVMNSNS